MRYGYSILIALVIILCSCSKSDQQNGLIGWDITFGVSGSTSPAAPGLTAEGIDSICTIVAGENEYSKIGAKHVILRKVKDAVEVKQKAKDFSKAVDDRIKDQWGEVVQVDSRYTKLQVVFTSDFDTSTETVAIYKYK